MDVKSSIRLVLTQSDFVVLGYLKDMTDQELLARPCSGANHIAWQLGHLIKSEHYLVGVAVPGSMRPLPPGFAEAHGKEACTSNDPAKFLAKEQYLKVMKQVREDTLAAVERITDAQLDTPVQKVPPFLNTAGETLLFIGGHWLMHAGQWAVTRRSLGRPPLF